jgi:hypothetical protein
MVQFCYPEVRSCITWAGCGSYPWLTILALILISFSTDEIYDRDRVTLNGLNNVPIGFPLQRSAKEGRYGLAVTSYSYLHGVRRANRRPPFHK